MRAGGATEEGEEEIKAIGTEAQPRGDGGNAGQVQQTDHGVAQNRPDHWAVVPFDVAAIYPYRLVFDGMELVLDDGV